MIHVLVSSHTPNSEEFDLTALMKSLFKRAFNSFWPSEALYILSDKNREEYTEPHPCFLFLYLYFYYLFFLYQYIFVKHWFWICKQEDLLSTVSYDWEVRFC